MIYITGDTHGSFKRFSNRKFHGQEGDYVLICGDFGGVWEDSDEQRHNLNWLSEKKYTILFADGNHENYDMLKEFPVEEWHGGKVSFIRPNVIHLKRGQVYDIEGKSFFVFGGARSHDIWDGILNPNDPLFDIKRRRLDRLGAMYRIDHVSWWKEEMPSAEEMDEGRRNLLAHQNNVDYIITHCCATSTQALLNFGQYEADSATDYLEEIHSTITWRKWFFGHYHHDSKITDTETVIYRDIISLPE